MVASSESCWKAGAAAGAPGAQPGNEEAGASDASSKPKTEKKADVVDADFEVVDEDKKK